MQENYLEWARNEALQDAKNPMYQSRTWDDAIIYKGAFRLEALGFELQAATWLAGITLSVARQRPHLLQGFGPSFAAAWGSLCHLPTDIQSKRFDQWVETPVDDDESFYRHTMSALKFVPDFSIRSLATIAQLRQQADSLEGSDAYRRYCYREFVSGQPNDATTG